MNGVVVVLAAVAGLVAVSYLIEALRPRPATPDRIPWAPDIPVR